MLLHYLQHVPFEDPASIIPWARGRGVAVSGLRLFANETLPPAQSLDWLVIMGGPMSVHDERELPWLIAEKRYVQKAIESGKVVIGICLGAQLIAEVLGAKVRKNAHPEIGWFPVSRTAASEQSAVFSQLPKEFPAFHWHGETFDVPPGAVHLATSEACPAQAFSIDDRVFGLQFHLESTNDSIENLIKNCADDLVPSPHVQDLNTIRAGCTENLPRIHAVMKQFLDAIAAR